MVFVDSEACGSADSHVIAALREYAVTPDYVHVPGCGPIPSSFRDPAFTRVPPADIGYMRTATIRLHSSFVSFLRVFTLLFTVPFFVVSNSPLSFGKDGMFLYVVSRYRFHFNTPDTP